MGPDKDAVSIVPTNWISDFDPTDTSRTYLVKKPVKGWQVVVVLQLAGKFMPLNLTVIKR